jgi:hypothetical protein
MVRKFMFVAASTALLALSSTVFAQGQFGTADEAKAMLIKAVAAVKGDKAKALALFAKGEGGFKDRDLYPFCFDISDGKVNPFANPNGKHLFGTDVRTQTDPTGKIYGLEFFAAAQKPEGQITEVNYMREKPGPNKTPVPKVSFVERAGDIFCGVGYYKQ